MNSKKQDFADFIAAATLPAGADIESDLIGTEGVFAGWGSTTGGSFSVTIFYHFCFVLFTSILERLIENEINAQGKAKRNFIRSI